MLYKTFALYLKFIKVLRSLVNWKELKHLVINVDMPVECTNHDKSIIDICDRYTMTSKKVIFQLICALKYIKSNNIQGDLVECGVYRGGNIICMKSHLNVCSTIFAYDTYEGMTRPGVNDVDIFGINAKSTMLSNNNDVRKNTAFCSLEEVKKIFVML